MEILNEQCSCGATSKFLRKKGAAVGLYCGNCEKWFKWVGKKDIDRYKQRGFKVHAENYSPNNQGHVQAPNNQTQYQQHEYPTTKQNGNTEFLGQYAQPSNSVPPHPYDMEPQHHVEEDALPEFGDSEEEEDYYHRPTNSLNKPSSYQEPPHHSHDDSICLTCISGVIEPLNNSTKITANIYDGVLNIKNNDKTKLYGSFSINFCPSCGKKL